MSEPWTPTNSHQELIECVARALMEAENKSTKADDMLIFFDPFDWGGKMSTRPGMYITENTPQYRRPAWTGPRILRMANAAIAAIL
jgi:hypothetical protein